MKDAPTVTGPLPCISDEDLHGFVDNELDPARKKSVAARLAASPVDAARAEAWRRQNEALRAAFAEMPSTATPPGTASRPWRAQGSSSSDCGAASPRVASAASVGASFAVVAGMAGAFMAGLLFERYDVVDRFRFDRASRGSVARSTEEPFVERTLRGVVPFDATRASPSTDTPQSGGVLIVPNLSGAGLKLQGIRSTAVASGSSLCLIYAAPADAEVTLCVDTKQGEAAAALRTEPGSSRPGISWRHKGARYSLSGALTDQELSALSVRAREEIDKFSAR